MPTFSVLNNTQHRGQLPKAGVGKALIIKREEESLENLSVAGSSLEALALCV